MARSLSVPGKLVKQRVVTRRRHSRADSIAQPPMRFGRPVAFLASAKTKSTKQYPEVFIKSVDGGSRKSRSKQRSKSREASRSVPSRHASKSRNGAKLKQAMLESEKSFAASRKSTNLGVIYHKAEGSRDGTEESFSRSANMFSHESTFRRPISIEVNGKAAKKRKQSKSKGRVEELLKELNTLLSKESHELNTRSRLLSPQ